MSMLETKALGFAAFTEAVILGNSNETSYLHQYFLKNIITI